MKAIGLFFSVSRATKRKFLQWFCNHCFVFDEFFSTSEMQVIHSVCVFCDKRRVLGTLRPSKERRF